jgi:hypothetical protein
MMRKRFLLFMLILIGFSHASRADSVAINRFEVKDNPFGNNQIAIVATDSLKNTLESVNGLFTFTVNGFEQQLTFNKGVAFYNPKIEKSIFLYVKHVNDSGTHSMLYYVYKHDNKLSPWHISWTVLLAVPLMLILFGYLFKRFIIIALIIFVFFLYFNHHSGLSLPTFFESIIDGLKNIF